MQNKIITRMIQATILAGGGGIGICDKKIYVLRNIESIKWEE